MPKEQHINTFDKGMTSDVNIIFQPDGTYRFAKNCQFISQDGNNYTIKDCLGNTLIFQINIPYATYAAPNVTFGLPSMPIGFISFPDKLVVFSTNDRSDTGGYGEIGVIYYDTYGEGIQPRVNSPTNTYSGYVPLYTHVSLKFTRKKMITGFAFNENEIHQRVYWTDNLNEPKVFDIANPIFTTYIASGSLVVGKQYMVLEGVVQHPVGGGNPVYAPHIATTNVFTASATTYTDLIAGNIPTTAKVIEYYPYQLLAFTPSRAMGNMKFNSYGVGSKLCGSKMYFYRLTDPLNGLFTSWSYGTVPIHVLAATSLAPSPANIYFDLSGGGTTNATLNSGKSVKIDIDNIDTKFTRIQVACAEFDQVVEVPRLISVVIDTAITGTSMTVEDIGNVNLGTLSLSDITLFPASILTCKTLTTNKNYILIGNIKERTEFTLDTSTVVLSEIIHKMPVHEEDPTLCTNVLKYTNVNPTLPLANPTFLIAGCQYVVTSLAGGNIVYNAVAYTFVGQVITGVTTTSAVVIPAGSQLRPCVSNVKYLPTGSATPTAANQINTIQLTTSYWDYKDPAVASHRRGHWALEKYRHAVVPFDLKGNPMYARWIGDFTFSALGGVGIGGTPISEYIKPAAGTNYDLWALNARGINVSGLRFTADEVAQMSGFSIMRADRDKRIITEGLLMQVAGSATLFRPCAGASPGTDTLWTGNLLTTQTYICPDALDGFSMPNFAVNSNLEMGCFFDPQVYSAGPTTLMKGTTADRTAFESRYFTAYNDGTTRKVKITALQTVDENVGITNFGSSNATFVNSTVFAAAPNPVNDACSGGAFYMPANFQGIGGKRTVVQTDAAFNIIGGAANYGDLPNCGVMKALFDVTVNNTNQYGGTSDTAKANTLYISTGHFQPIDATVLADTLTGGGYYEFNGIQIWGGDCFTNVVTYGHTLSNGAANLHSWGIKFACQSNSNYDLRRGRTIGSNGMHETASGVNFTTPQLESFEYNKGYSSNGVEFAYPALPVNFSFATLFKYRVRFAGQKFPNEIINSFRNFFINDYKDANGQLGEINNLATKNDRTFVFQNSGVSTTPILERQLLAGSAGAQTVIGTGGVVDRFDVLNSYFGNQHQFGLVPTEYGFTWFDMRRKGVITLDISGGISEISKVAGLSGLFNETFIDNLGNTLNSQPLNSPSFSDTADQPLVGVGIVGVYDPKFKMTYLTFKFVNFPTADQGISQDFTIGYYHLNKAFVAFFDWTPAIAHNHNQIVISANNPCFKTRFYGPGMASTDFIAGDVIYNVNKNIQYICIANVTIAVYADPPNPTYFQLINQTNQLWVHNQPLALGQATAPGYQYLSFFGQVVNSELWLIVNPKTDNPFSVLHMEQKGNLVNITDLTITADNQTASDSSITGTNRFYRRIYDRICSNMPLSITGRITNSYLLIKLIKKNWTTDPRVLTGSVRFLQYIKSFFTQKR